MDDHNEEFRIRRLEAQRSEAVAWRCKAYNNDSKFIGYTYTPAPFGLEPEPLFTSPPFSPAMRAALEWYAEQVAGCRKLGSAGDSFRQALDRDGGKRATAALAEVAKMLGNANA